MGLIYQEQFHVRGRDVNRFGVMTLATLAKLLLEVSGQQTDRLNEQFGNPLASKQLTWFILQHDLTIHRMPKFNDELLIETEAVAYNRFFTHRTFRVWCKKELIVETMMRFAIVDIVERKLVRITPDLVVNYQATEMKKLEAMAKIDKLDGTPHKITEYQTYFSHIDINQHVNNAVYLDWLVDSLENDFLANHIPQSISIVYENEVTLGDCVIHELYQNDLITTHYLRNGEKSAAKAQIKWQKN